MLVAPENYLGNFERNVDAGATLKDSGSIDWGGAGHWQFLKIPTWSPVQSDVLFFSICPFIQCSWVLFPVHWKHIFGMEMLQEKKQVATGSRVLAHLPSLPLPMKCHPSGALSNSPPKYFPRCCPVSFLPHWDSKSLTQSPWVVSWSN